MEDNINENNSDYETIKSISKFIATQRAFFQLFECDHTGIHEETHLKSILMS